MATELERKLIEQIKLEGPITFRDFMQAALYDPELGYYNTERLKIGAEGDYYTSSNIHPAFGAVLAQAFSNLWAERSEPLTIVEMGAGTGQLARDVLATICDEHPVIFEAITYVIVETSPAMRKRQQDKVAQFMDHIQWSNMEELEAKSFAGIVFSNEFVDAMSIHRLRCNQTTFEELYVTTCSHTGLAFQWAGVSTQRLLEYIERMQATLQAGQVVEINLDAIDWLARITGGLESGFLITIDYGDLVEHLWSPERRLGTLRSFHKHQLKDSPLERTGEQDMTASVNFTALIEYGRDFGFETVSYEKQTSFLTRMGLIEKIAARYGDNESLEDLKERLAVKNLFVPAGISDSFRVLIQQKGPIYAD